MLLSSLCPSEPGHIGFVFSTHCCVSQPGTLPGRLLLDRRGLVRLFVHPGVCLSSFIVLCMLFSIRRSYSKSLSSTPKLAISFLAARPKSHVVVLGVRFLLF